MANPIKSKEIAFNGRLRTFEDPVSIGPNDFVTLQNMRYTDTHPKSINGMSEITSTGLGSNIDGATHFRKGQPSESHILVHAGTGIYDMSAAVPGTGAFGSSLWTDTTSGGTPRFASVNGLLAYANGVGDTCVYGGDEFRCGGFTVYTAGASGAKYDYTEAVNNTLTTAGNVATLKTYQSSADSNTMLLLHCDGTHTGTTFTDSSPSPKTVTAYTGAITSTTEKKFGTASGYFPGTGYLTTPDHADFNFSGGTFTIDFWYKSGGNESDGVIFHQQTDANNYIQLLHTGYDIRLQINSASSPVVVLQSASNSVSTSQWSHIAIVESGDNWYLFINGILKASASDTDRAANYTGDVYIGSSGAANYLDAYIDEFRVSNSARWTADFTPPSSAYGADYVSNVYLRSIMPISGTKLYVANSQSGKTVSIAVNEWNGSGWSSLAIDPTSQVLANSTAYSITWPSTASTSKMREIDKTFQYSYQLVLSSPTDFDGVTISRCTVKIPFQQIKDMWDGKPWPLAAFLVNKSSGFQDYTAHVSEDTYDSANTGSYAVIDALTTSDSAVIGSTERLMGAYLQFPGDKINNTLTTISVSYYNGTDTPDQAGAWSTASGVTDGTLNGNKCFAKSGFVAWSPPTEGSEFKSAAWSSKKITHVQKTGFTVEKTDTVPYGESAYPLYYYKFTFTGVTLAADIRVSYAYGVPAQKTIRGFKLPVVHQDRLWLCGDVNKEKNYVLCSAYQSPTVLGFGDDNAEFWLGDDTELVAGASLFTRYGSNVADVLVLCKQNETYVIDGNNVDDYKVRRVSEYIGCIAPKTMCVVPMGDEAIPGIPRNIAIWLSQQGVVAFDGTNFAVVSKDIHDKFDPANSNYIGSTLSTATAYYDPIYGEYHLIIPDSSEYVYDVSKKKWYTANRGSYALRVGLPVHDTNGLAYTFGASDTKLYRLENGTTMAGESYERILRTGELALPEGSIMEYARVNWLMLIAKTMTNDVTQTYYTDSATSSSGSTSIISTNTGKRLMNEVAHNKDTQATFHGFEFIVADAFEPLYMAFRYTIYPREQA